MKNVIFRTFLAFVILQGERLTNLLTTVICCLKQDCQLKHVNGWEKELALTCHLPKNIILLHSQRRNGATQLFFYNRKRKTHQWIHGRCVRANTWNNPCPPLSGITEAERDENETYLFTGIPNYTGH